MGVYDFGHSPFHSPYFTPGGFPTNSTFDASAASFEVPPAPTYISSYSSLTGWAGGNAGDQGQPNSIPTGATSTAPGAQAIHASGVAIPIGLYAPTPSGSRTTATASTGSYMFDAYGSGSGAGASMTGSKGQGAARRRNDA